jgi:hypothetical protein
MSLLAPFIMSRLLKPLIEVLRATKQIHIGTCGARHLTLLGWQRNVLESRTRLNTHKPTLRKLTHHFIFTGGAT